jgi:hypothetical protein
LHLVGFFIWIILWCMDPWTSNKLYMYLVSSNSNNETCWYQSLMTCIWYSCNLQHYCKLVCVCVCVLWACIFVIPCCNWWYLKCWLRYKVTYCKPYCYGPYPRFCVPHWMKDMKFIHPNEEGNIDLNFVMYL